MKFILKLIFIVLVLGVALIAKDVASVTGLNGSASVLRDGSKLGLHLGDKLREKDRITTGEKTKVQIIFEDQTIITIGKNSIFSIDEYLYDDTKKPIAKFGMLKGAMRTITGKIGKVAPQKFSVATKTATIGIRGTNFGVVVGDDNSHSIYCTLGAINVTLMDREHMVREGFYLTLDSLGAVAIEEFTSEMLQNMTEKSFGKGVAKDGDIVDAPMMDNTKKYTRDVVVKQLSLVLGTAVQEEIVKELYDKYKHLIPEEIPYVPVIPETSDTPNSQQLYLGSIVGTDNIYGGAHLLFSNNTIQYGTFTMVSFKQDDWDITLGADTQKLDYISKEKFSTTLLAMEDTAEASNVVVNYSSFKATGDDLVDGDYMSWGSWSLEASFNDSDADKTYSFGANGLWVNGEATKFDVGILKGTARYEGIYRAFYNSNNSDIFDGKAVMDIDFGADTATLMLDKIKIDNMMIKANTVFKFDEKSGDIISTGYFYGPDAQSVAGSFNTNGMSGVYQVSSTHSAK